jgi:hypothetical protein
MTDGQIWKKEKRRTDRLTIKDGVDNRQPMVKFGKGKMENRPSDNQRWGRQPMTDGQIRKKENRTSRQPVTDGQTWKKKTDNRPMTTTERQERLPRKYNRRRRRRNKVTHVDC